MREAAIAVKQHVIEQRVFVREAEAGANHGLVILLGIPSDAHLRSKILVGLLDAAAQTCAELVDEVAGACEQSGRRTGDGSKVAIGATGIANVAQADRQREVGFHFPGVAHIELNASVRGFAAGETEAWTLGEEALSVSDRKRGDRVIQRIGGIGTGRQIEVRADDGRAADEGGKNAVLDAIDTRAEAQRVLAESFGAVVFGLLVALEGFLRCQKTGSGTKRVGASGKAVGVAADLDGDAGRGIKDTAAKDGVVDAVAEFRVADAQAVGPGSVTIVHADGMHRSVVSVGKRLEVVGDDALHGAVLLVRKAIKDLEILARLPVDATYEHGVVER